MTLAAFNMFAYSYTAESEALEHLIQELCIDLELARPKKHAATLKDIVCHQHYLMLESMGNGRGDLYHRLIKGLASSNLQVVIKQSLFSLGIGC